MNERANLIAAVMGRPWQANAKGPDAFDCWHLCVWMQRTLFDRDVPAVIVPDKPSWAWMIRTISDHPERKNWREVRRDAMGLVTAKDGALVLMARSDRPAHIGTWLAPERMIIHADPTFGVVCDKLLDLNTKGWTRLRFYEPAGDAT